MLVQNSISYLKLPEGVVLPDVGRHSTNSCIPRVFKYDKILQLLQKRPLSVADADIHMVLFKPKLEFHRLGRFRTGIIFVWRIRILWLLVVLVECDNMLGSSLLLNCARASQNLSDYILGKATAEHEKSSFVEHNLLRLKQP